MSKADRRARKRIRKSLGADGDLRARCAGRIVCDKCGQEQPFRTSDDPDVFAVAPCVGPLGLPCDSESAVWLDSFLPDRYSLAHGDRSGLEG